MYLVLTLILADSSIELVPNQIAHHPAVISGARRKGKDPHELILDQSYHHRAIGKLGRAGLSRGRPDIAHYSLLIALGSSLNLEGQLQCYVHTRDDNIISIAPKARLPRNTERFVSLLEQLYKESKVPPSGPPLMMLKRRHLASLLDNLSPDSIIALTRVGSPRPLEEIAGQLDRARRPLILVGGFSHGHFSERTLSLAPETCCIDKRSLDAWTVVARTLYDYERAIGLKRF